MYDQIELWLIKEYKEAGIEGLQIKAVMGAIKDTIKHTKIVGMFEHRLAVSKYISVLVYPSNNVEVHISRPGLSIYKYFTKG